MLKKIIKDFLSFFNLEIVRKNYYLNSHFFSKKEITPKIINQIFKFHQKIEPFYNNLNLPDSLKIGKAWTSILKESRKDQIKYIKENNTNDYKNKLEKMFFNGFAGVDNCQQSKEKYLSKSHFNSLYLTFESITENNIEVLTDNYTWSKWGFKTKKGIVSPSDLNAGIQANNIFLLAKFFALENNKKNFTIIDLGSGHDSAAEKILRILEKNKKEIILNLILIDIPLNLAIAYAYLKKIFPLKKIFLISDKKELKEISLNKQEKIILVPTIFCKEVKKFFKIDILNNQASLSEMDYANIKFYLQLFIDKNLSYFIETNVNNKFYTNKFFDGTSQTLSRNFPIPKTHKLLMSFNRIGTEKYVTKIYKKV